MNKLLMEASRFRTPEERRSFFKTVIFTLAFGGFILLMRAVL